MLWHINIKDRHFLSMCLHQPRKVTDHVYVCCVYRFCLVLRFYHLYWNSSYNVVSLFVILLINLTLTLWMLLYNDATDILSWFYFVEIVVAILFMQTKTLILSASVSVLTLSGVHRVFKPRSVQTILFSREAWTVVSIS